MKQMNLNIITLNNSCKLDIILIKFGKIMFKMSNLNYWFKVYKNIASEPSSPEMCSRECVVRRICHCDINFRIQWKINWSYDLKEYSLCLFIDPRKNRSMVYSQYPHKLTKNESYWLILKTHRFSWCSSKYAAVEDRISTTILPKQPRKNLVLN